MRSGFALTLILAFVFSSGYFYYIASAACDVPISYAIGDIDARFDINTEEVRNIVSEAESMWEDATGQNLFSYEEDGELLISFVYDDRQELADEEHELRNTLERKENLSDQVRSEYVELLEEYDKLKELYEQNASLYEADLDAHNQEVEEWNSRGGAPSQIFKKLGDTQSELKERQEELNDIAAQLNLLAKKMNAIGAQGNSVITDYNEIVEEYNSRFNEIQEFTQGEYEDKTINIYQFDSREELVIVLAHEFGHALSLGHVEGEKSIMFHFMGAQSIEEAITSEDLAEFEAVCGEKTFLEMVLIPIRNLWEM